MSKINELIAQGEHDTQDFKLKIEDSKKIAITLSAFSNSKGGSLLIGVKDNRAIAGVKSVEEEFHMVKAAAELYCKPEISVEPELHQEGGKKVLRVLIPKSKEPIFARNPEDKWRVYFRVKDENFMANSVLLKSMKGSTGDTDVVQLKPKILEFLSLVKNQDSFGFNLARRKLRLNSRKTEDFLANLLRWNIIQYQISKGNIQYSINLEHEITDDSQF